MEREFELGPISGFFWNLGTMSEGLESIPIIGIPFLIFEFMMGFIAAFFANQGLK